MHEGTLITDLVHKVEAIALQENAKRVKSVSIRVGDFSHASPEHLREHFEHDTKGTVAEGARLEVQTISDIRDPKALEIVLESLEIET